MNFQEAEAYLYSLGNEVETMKLGLENITKLLAALGGPQSSYKKVQVAGTNGKGSVCAFLDSICGEADIRRGLYTSPHLVSITERIRIDGVDITDDEFAKLATRVRETAESLLLDGRLAYRPTFFEQVTAIALLAFAKAGVELAILETGLGGRYDAVTAARAEIVAITRIDLDHQEYLGETLEEIAAEKAAIIREDSLVVLSHQSRAVEQVLMGRCREVGVEPSWASTDIRLKDEPEIAPALFGSITTTRAHYGFLELWHMLGRHQFENAAIAIGIAEALSDTGFRLSTDQIALGVDTASYSGRLESIHSNFLLDGAHNVGGAKALAHFLNEFYSERPITMIFGSMRDKNVGTIAEILWPLANRLVLTQPSNSRALTADELAAFVPAAVDAGRIVRTLTVVDAIAKAREVTPQGGLILVTGSLYLVGEVKKLLQTIPEI